VKKKGCLGCSFPLLITIAIIIIALTVFGFISGSIGRSIFGNIGPTWLQVPNPEPQLPPEAILYIGGFGVTNTMLTAWISIVIVILLSYLAFRRPKLVPSGLQVVMEFVFGSLLSFCQSIAGEKNGRRFFPVISSIFLFVLANAWISLLPFYGDAIYRIVGEHHVPLFRGANTDLNLTLALAIFAFVCIEYYGIKDLGFFHYVGKFLRLGQIKRGICQLFTGKVKPALGLFFFGFIDFAVGILELVSEYIRIISFSFRLFGNMLAGEILLLVTAFLIPMIFAIPFYGLEFLFSFVQALIFSSLTLVFITIAVSNHEEVPE
jgi:F-type H+-transporting ATPase subunit a